jgi:hypothetical protein
MEDQNVNISAPINMEQLKQNEEIINAGNLELEKEQEKQLKTMPPHPLKVGDNYKITGGKYKKHKEGTLMKINDTYSDVQLGGQSNLCPGKIVKIKNSYLFAKDPPGIEMPDADGLKIVDNLEDWMEHNPDDAKKWGVGPDPDGVLEINELGEEVDNITDILPSLEEAIALKKENKSLKEHNAWWSGNDSSHKKENEELKEQKHILSEQCKNLLNTMKTNREEALEKIIINLMLSQHI